MFEWKNVLDEYTAVIRTSFALLRVDPDIEHSPGMEVIRYSALIQTINGMTLRRQDNIESMATARLWCEQAYRELLTDELARFS